LDRFIQLALPWRKPIGVVLFNNFHRVPEQVCYRLNAYVLFQVFPDEQVSELVRMSIRQCRCKEDPAQRPPHISCCCLNIWIAALTVPEIVTTLQRRQAMKTIADRCREQDTHGFIRLGPAKNQVLSVEAIRS
jgi:hypothetical protein